MESALAPGETTAIEHQTVSNTPMKQGLRRILEPDPVGEIRFTKPRHPSVEESNFFRTGELFQNPRTFSESFVPGPQKQSIAKTIL